MSDSISVKINCFHSGVFETEDGKLNYVDGLLDQFEVDGDAAYEEVRKIIVKIVRVGRMWYKLPFEDISEKKELLENDEKTKRRMISNGRWYEELDVFIEKPETDILTGDGAVVDAVTGHVDAVTGHEPVDGDEFDVEQQDDNSDGDHGDHETRESEDEYQASDESDKEEDIDRNFKEDLEMFRDENYDDEIPDEEETFYISEEFKKQVIKYILKTRRNIVFSRWEKTKICAKCSGKCKLIKSPTIAEVMLKKIRKEPEMSAPMIRGEFRDKFNIIISPEQARLKSATQFHLSFSLCLKSILFSRYEP
ncbi:hypothetical protein F2Q68_00031472 [Brassica cretica]|uniref:Transposase MuDR plant domain-containing protein n=1 Tax=Brassica cretica TaxID=69181 RepID=A0A8S9GAI3_BRACR|nr:hypothetical protein F2Q68_00031472 [Brassica cretica]